jgi:hypothetical protein
MSVPILGEKTMPEDSNEPHIRLLVCRNCKTIEELPDYQGRPSDDLLLNISVEKHQKPDPHIGLLFRFPLKFWVVPKIREEIIKQIGSGSSGLDVFGTQFYETKMAFHDDAMKCYNQHLRPKGQCPDYKSEKKMLKPTTDAERKDVGLGKAGEKGPKIYLCDFCPVKSFNMKKFNEKKGLYK